MENMNIYSMAEIYKKANDYSRQLNKNGKLEYIQIGISEKDGVIILVHYKIAKKKYLGSFRLT